MSDYVVGGPAPSSEHTRNVTAFFDSQSAAEKARADLIAAGLSPDTISMAGGDMAGGGVRDDRLPPGEEGGFWHALKEFFIPDEDRYTYAEGLRRGGYAVSVRSGEAQYDRAIDILDADGAVDIDERQESWRSEGWSGYTPGADVLDPDVSVAVGDASTAGFGVSRAGEDGYTRTDRLTTGGMTEAEARADSSRVGTGPGEAGVLNPDMRERIGSGTASMTPPTPTGPQDATLYQNASAPDVNRPSYTSAVEAEDATLGSPTRSGSEMPAARSTVGSMTSAQSTADRQAAAAGAWSSRRDDTVQRARVRGYIIDPDKPDQASGI